jgi:rhomboid family GlyGly-CTERM serine protease
MGVMRRWLPLSGFILLMLLLQLVGPEHFRYETRAIHDLQLWRLLSGHWVHANWVHYVLNMAGFVLCLALTDIHWSSWQWGWRILLLSLGISLCFYGLQPDMGWYVGFSGVLFGLYILAASATLRIQPLLSGLLLAFIAIKIILEQWSSANITSGDLIGVPVLVDAHFYGVLLAIFIIIIQFIFNRLKDKP